MGRTFYLPCRNSEMSAGKKFKSFQKVTDNKKNKINSLNNFKKIPLKTSENFNYCGELI